MKFFNVYTKIKPGLYYYLKNKLIISEINNMNFNNIIKAKIHVDIRSSSGKS